MAVHNNNEETLFKLFGRLRYRELTAKEAGNPMPSQLHSHEWDAYLKATEAIEKEERCGDIRINQIRGEAEFTARAMFSRHNFRSSQEFMREYINTYHLWPLSKNPASDFDEARDYYLAEVGAWQPAYIKKVGYVDAQSRLENLDADMQEREQTRVADDKVSEKQKDLAERRVAEKAQRAADIKAGREAEKARIREERSQREAEQAKREESTETLSSESFLKDLLGDRAESTIAIKTKRGWKERERLKENDTANSPGK